jgi:hypothetical protein
VKREQVATLIYVAFYDDVWADDQFYKNNGHSPYRGYPAAVTIVALKN